MMYSMWVAGVGDLANLGPDSDRHRHRYWDTVIAKHRDIV